MNITTIVCTTCKTENKPNAVFCKLCGSKLPRRVQENPRPSDIPIDIDSRSSETAPSRTDEYIETNNTDASEDKSMDASNSDLPEASDTMVFEETTLHRPKNEMNVKVSDEEIISDFLVETLTESEIELAYRAKQEFLNQRDSILISKMDLKSESTPASSSSMETSLEESTAATPGELMQGFQGKTDLPPHMMVLSVDEDLNEQKRYDYRSILTNEPEYGEEQKTEGSNDLRQAMNEVLDLLGEEIDHWSHTMVIPILEAEIDDALFSQSTPSSTWMNEQPLEVLQAQEPLSESSSQSFEISAETFRSMADSDAVSFDSVPLQLTETNHLEGSADAEPYRSPSAARFPAYFSTNILRQYFNKQVDHFKNAKKDLTIVLVKMVLENAKQSMDALTSRLSYFLIETLQLTEDEVNGYIQLALNSKQDWIAVLDYYRQRYDYPSVIELVRLINQALHLDFLRSYTDTQLEEKMMRYFNIPKKQYKALKYKFILSPVEKSSMFDTH